VISDKNSNFLEKQLKTLGQKVRLDILKKLKNSQNDISFSKLQKDVLEGNSSTVNLSFHLNALKKCELINNTENGYYITQFGKKIFENILSIERILGEKSKLKMIRTSKYSKELFDSNKIEEFLITEGDMELFLARQIAREVEDRLANLNIEYLTAPLMREYTNAILLENGLEEVRHKLTRLGTPPYEVFKLFNSMDSRLTPERFINKLGSDVSEQFILLNLIPKNLADLYLSGEIALLYLNYWSLRPLSLYISSETILSYISKKHPVITNKIETSRDCLKLILYFFDFLYQVKQFYSEDVLLGAFKSQFLNYVLNNDSHVTDLFTSQFIRFSQSFFDDRQHITLELKNNSGDPLTKRFFKFLAERLPLKGGPLLLYGYSSILENNMQYIKQNDLFSPPLRDNIVLYNNDGFNLLNSTNIKICNSKQNRIILDKILINLHMISVEANQNDDRFFDLLQKKLDSVFELFKLKENFVKKRLGTINEWNSLIPHIFGEKNEGIINNSIKSVSFFGLNKAILNHCGIELDRTESSASFALKSMRLMKNLIKEKNETENDRYTLSQPHNDTYLSDSWSNGVFNPGGHSKAYTSEIIRENSSLSLVKKISLFKKFEDIIDGGTIFNPKITEINAFKKNLNLLYKSKIGAISFRNY